MGAADLGDLIEKELKQAEELKQARVALAKGVGRRPPGVSVTSGVAHAVRNSHREVTFLFFEPSNPLFLNTHFSPQ